MASPFRTTSLLLIAFLLTFSLSACTTTPTPKPVHETIVYDTASVTGMRENLYHSIAPGETLWRIAQMYDVDIETIKAANKIRDVKDIDIGTKLYIPGASPRRHVITMYPSRKWKYIIIHHSATDFGNSTQFNKAHLNRGWAGVGYHFVIDNGTCGKDDGQIETTPRWIQQSDGAHCKAGSMNEQGIGICLVGNFSAGDVSAKQMNSLVLLVNKLRSYYRIPKSHIMGHGQVVGANTECPGKNFPWATFWAKLGR